MNPPTLSARLARKRRWAIPLLLGLMAALLWLALRPPLVDSVTVQATRLVRSVQFSARVATLARVDLGSTLTARVAQVLVREGAKVRAGDALVRLESDELQAALAQAQAAQTQAQARLLGLRSTGGFEWRVALRFLREGRMQTLLIIVGVAAGVAVIAYISALINGLQANTLAKTLGAQAHISLRAPDDLVTPAALPVPALAALTETQPRAQRLRSVANWQALVPLLERLPAVAGVSPMVSGRAWRCAARHRRPLP
jgi:multidrug efflux pump subunit AcrA (membrane-fusion protein)